MLRRLPLALLLAGAATVAAQEPVSKDPARRQPFQVAHRFEGGEQWLTRTTIRTTTTPIGQGEEQGEVTTVAWTESAQVVGRPVGFALRSTLTSWRMDQQGPNASSEVRYDDHDLSTIEVGPGHEVPTARTWTYEYDGAWRLLAVDGQHETLRQLWDHARHERARDEGDDGRHRLRGWFARQLRPFLVDRATERLDEGLRAATNDALAPVRVVMERVRGGDALAPDFEAKVDRAGELPAGVVRYVGREQAGARFRVAFDVQGCDAAVPEYTFTIDDAGRLARLDLTTTKIDRGSPERPTRVTQELSFALEPTGAAPRTEDAARPRVGGDTGVEQDAK